MAPMTGKKTGMSGTSSGWLRRFRRISDRFTPRKTIRIVKLVVSASDLKRYQQGQQQHECHNDERRRNRCIGLAVDPGANGGCTATVPRDIEKKPRRGDNLGQRPVDDDEKTGNRNRQTRPAGQFHRLHQRRRCPGNDVEFTRTDQRHRDQHVEDEDDAERDHHGSRQIALHIAHLFRRLRHVTEADEGIDREDRAGKQHAEAVEAEGERHRARLPRSCPQPSPKAARPEMPSRHLAAPTTQREER